MTKGKCFSLYEGLHQIQRDISFSHHEHKFFYGHASVRCKSCEDQRFSKQGNKSTAIKTDSAYEIAEECLITRLHVHSALFVFPLQFQIALQLLQILDDFYYSQHLSKTGPEPLVWLHRQHQKEDENRNRPSSTLPRCRIRGFISDKSLRLA